MYIRPSPGTGFVNIFSSMAVLSYLCTYSVILNFQTKLKQTGTEGLAQADKESTT